MPDLDRLERWMQEVITHPEGVEKGLCSERARVHIPIPDSRLEDVVEPSRMLTSVERMRIYSNMYFWRLIDILAEEFPTVRHILGPERFGEIVTAYVTLHPSTHPNLNQFGKPFPRFLVEEAENIDSRHFVSEVALLERSMEEIFDAPQEESVSIDDLLRIPSESWGTVRFRTIPALRLHAFRYPVNDFVQAVREDRHLDLPGEKESWVAVYRHDYTVWRAALNRVQYRLLGALMGGVTLGSALEECVEGSETGIVMENLSSWFQEWTAEGLFSAIDLESE